MNVETRLAFDLLARLHALVGPVTVVQCDLVVCEDAGRTIMAYLYHDPASDACVGLCFDTPPDFDPAALTAALEATGTVH
jgi:hypothetical protein